MNHCKHCCHCNCHEEQKEAIPPYQTYWRVYEPVPISPSLPIVPPLPPIWVTPTIGTTI